MFQVLPGGIIPILSLIEDINYNLLLLACPEGLATVPHWP